MKKRETFSGRIGFLLMTAGCAIGLGNIWRFPYVAGKHGGGLFLLLYLVCLALLGFPAVTMELAIGRAGHRTLPGALFLLRPKESRFRWDIPGAIAFFGNLVLLMFYSVVTGWLIAYACKYAASDIRGTSTEFFEKLLASWPEQTFFMLVVLTVAVVVCSGGIRASVEKVVKWMMGGLFVLLFLLVVKALTLPGAARGVAWLFKPDAAMFGKDFFGALCAAMEQAFFTLSVGMGTVALCGSYLGRDRALAPESVWIIVLDTLVAVMAGVIVFCCCAAFGVAPDGGPPLIFIALPRVFESMTGGRIWGAVFFVFLSVAALSTVVAVFEAFIAFGIETFGIGRKKCCLLYGFLCALCAIPCILGFNVLRDFHPLGGNSNILDLEDFIVSGNLLPLGMVCMTLFVGWSWGTKALFGEINRGDGWKISPRFAFYYHYVLPVLLLFLWAVDLFKRFC